MSHISDAIKNSIATHVSFIRSHSHANIHVNILVNSHASTSLSAKDLLKKQRFDIVLSDRSQRRRAKRLFQKQKLDVTLNLLKSNEKKIFR